MKIGMNLQILSDRNAGVGTYARSLAQALTRGDGEDRYVLFGNPDRMSGLEQNGAAIVPTALTVSGNRRRILWEQFVLPRKVRHQSLDVMHYPDHTASLLGKSCPVVITIHDLAFLAFPRTFRLARRTYKALAVRRSVHLADLVIADSMATQRECIKLLEVPEEKIRVVHLGVDERFKPVTDSARLEAVRTRYGLAGEIVLYVGTLEPRKNIVRLLRAFHVAAARKEREIKLVIAGGKGWMFQEIFSTVESLGLAGEVVFTDFVPAEELPVLYSLAGLFVYPSLYEGFGFPPLEAMACGCPVITSNTSSMPEVCGDAALYVDPYQVDDIAEKIDRLLADEHQRAALREKGFARAASFTWDKTAREHRQVFHEAAS